MKRGLTILAVLVAAQALMIGGWWLVERGRRAPGQDAPTGGATFEAVARPAPALRIFRRDGSTGTLPTADARTVVHFWATWCPPCREELPAMLRWAETADVVVLAVSLDPEWPAVVEFLGGDVPATVVRADAEAAREWGVDGLPATVLVDPHGQITHVARGPLDWRTIDVAALLGTD